MIFAALLSQQAGSNPVFAFFSEKVHNGGRHLILSRLMMEGETFHFQAEMTMKNLKRPLVVFDLETTSTDTKTARTVQIAMLKIHPNGQRQRYQSLVNPGCLIPPGSTAVHGVSDADVADAPQLAELAAFINSWTRDADLAGHNGISFDLEILQRELLEAGLLLAGPEDQAFIDTLKLEQHLRPNTLSAVYERRTGKPLEGAHDAMVDVEATAAILASQLKELGGKRSALEIETLLRGDFADRQRKFKHGADGDLVFGFGMHKGKSVRQVYFESPGYIKWMGEKMGPEVMKTVRQCLNAAPQRHAA